jgi:membrane-bound serine protease (ClpP class)
MKRFGLFLTFLAALLLFSRPVQAQDETPRVLVLKADGVVAPAMKEYIQRGIKVAENQGYDLMVLQLNTPGGDIGTMTDIVEAMRQSHVPIVVYVTPRGAMAGSAGTLITLAGHAAAMSPETIIGAASPIDSSGQDLGETAKKKEMEALTALVRSIASRRSEQAIKLAESTITEAKAVSASEALSAGLVDFIATDLNDLLRQLNGYKVMIFDQERTLATVNAQTDNLGMSFIEQLLDILVNPNIVFLLVTIGVQAILIELSSPGGWVAGFIGAVALALAAYGLGVLPVNWFGAVFMIIAFALFVLDIKAPTHGALTAAGVGSFIVGALVLFNSPGVPQFQRVSIPLVVATGIIVGVSFAVILAVALRAQRAPIRMGQETLVGQHGTARGKIDPRGQVQLQSELWSAELAEGATPIQAGEKVTVVSVQGVRLKVRKAD